MDIQELLSVTLDKKASDLHLSQGLAPKVRIDGDLYDLDYPILSEDILNELISSTLTPSQLEVYKKNLELDYAYALPDKGRFRVNAFHQARGLAAAFRAIPSKVPNLEDLHLPPEFAGFCNFPNGIILVTGPTGSGKSTTLAAMLNTINKNDSSHIITIEDPIEFTHQSQKCLINQREVNRDTLSFNAALRSALREDPDIILVGEMRDLETIRLALTAAETGHLVFATLHTNSAAKTIDRIIDVFPAGEKDMIRAMLSESLRVIIAQTLLKRVDKGRIAAVEVLVNTLAIRNLIRENKIPQIYSAMQTSQSLGMCTLEQYIAKLRQENLIEAGP